jgi:hypothetical protein
MAALGLLMAAAQPAQAVPPGFAGISGNATGSAVAPMVATNGPIARNGGDRLSSAGEPASIEGTIVDPQGFPIPGAQVLVYDDALSIIASGTSNGSGGYATTTFPPAAVYVRAAASGYLYEVLGATGCAPDCAISDGTPLQASGGITAGVDFVLHRAGSISGHISDPDGLPLAGAEVSVWRVAGNGIVYGDSVLTNAAGNYRVGDLPDARYSVTASAGGDLVDTAWPGVQCAYDCFAGLLPTVALAPGEELQEIDVQLIAGGRIAGAVISAGSGDPIVGALVNFETAGGESFAGAAVTEPDGSYRSPALPPASYRAYTRNTGAHVDEVFDDVPCTFLCDAAALLPIMVSAGADSIADFVLEPGGRVSGRVTDSSTGLPIGPFRPRVLVLDEAGATVSQALANSAGNWISGGLPAGNYRVRTRNRSGHVDQLFDGTACYWCVPPGGTPVPVMVGGTTTGIDMALVAGARLAGRVTVAGTGQGIRSAVEVHDATGRYITDALAAPGGSWTITNGLAAGTYFLRTRSLPRYIDVLYGGTACAGECDATQGVPVVVGAGDLDGLDFELVEVPTIFIDGFG